MTQKVFNLVKGVAAGVEMIAVAAVTYYVGAKDASLAAAINASITIGITAVVEICGKFVKEENK